MDAFVRDYGTLLQFVDYYFRDKPVNYEKLHECLKVDKIETDSEREAFLQENKGNPLGPQQLVRWGSDDFCHYFKTLHDSQRTMKNVC